MSKATMSKHITLNKVGYEPFLDFIKAYAIVCVLLGHAIPGKCLDYIAYGLWAGMQVPLFILVQSFHSLKKDSVRVNMRKLLWRIFVPFFLVEIITFAILLAGTNNNVTALLNHFVLYGGYGPGSYFPWVYLQVALLLPIAAYLFHRIPRKWLLPTVLIVCEALEVLCSVINLPDSLYRLLAVRYLFLFYLGWIWVVDGIILNKTNVLLSLASLLSIIYFEYISVNDEPLFFLTEWKFHRWPCYAFVALMGGGILWVIYQKTKSSQIIASATKLLAKCSYEIFLIQMAFIAISPIFLDQIDNLYIRMALRFVLIFVVSIVGGVMFQQLNARWINNKKNG